MKIRALFPDEGDLEKVQKRFYGVAEARGIAREEALRQALLDWLRADAEPTVVVTDEEWKELAPVLKRLRGR